MPTFLPLDKITVPPHRQRLFFDPVKLQELTDGIRVAGLINPIVVTRQPDGTYILNAGERRYKAFSTIWGNGEVPIIRHGLGTIPPGHIPVTEWADLSETERFELELQENALRQDLSWQEHATAVKKLHEFRRVANPGHSPAATADEANILPSAHQGMKAARVNAEVSVAKFLHMPEVAGAKTLREAQKVVDRMATRTSNIRLAAEVERRIEANPEASPHVLIRGDCYEIATQFEDASFDLAMFDPPYGIGADDFGDQAATGHEYEDDEGAWERFCKEWPDMLIRILKPSAHVYVFHDILRFDEVKLDFEMAGFRVWKRPLIWVKTLGMLPRPSHGPRNTYEAILFATLGDKPVQVTANDTLPHASVARPQHGAEKPSDLYRDLIGRSCRPGDRVLDAFCGVGSIFPAASDAKVYATGIEKSSSYADIAALRLKETLPSLLDNI